MRSFLILLVFSICLISCKDASQKKSKVATGQMPNAVKDNAQNFHLVYGNGDSILYSYSTDKGQTFSSPILISIVPKLAASHMRGPQIAVTNQGLLVTACNQMGDIFSFTKTNSGAWLRSARVNDMDTTAKENLMALASDGDNAFAVWLDLRYRHNKIFGAKSTDGGKSWSKNMLVYASPDTTVCECCKPSAVIKGNNIYVMFRNWLNGNRDLYLIESSDGGSNFGQAQKLGIGTWPLKGCPMDGGAITIDKNGSPETVWNRKGIIYACKPGEEENKIGEGKNCTMETVNGKNVYAWIENGNIIIRKPQGMERDLGKGHSLVMKAINNEHILCIWENDKQIYKAILEL